MALLAYWESTDIRATIQSATEPDPPTLRAWRDSSGRGWYFRQPDPSLRPRVMADELGVRAVQFTDDDQRMILAAPPALVKAAGGPISMVVVGAFDDTLPPQSSIIGFRSAGGANDAIRRLEIVQTTGLGLYRRSADGLTVEAVRENKTRQPNKRQYVGESDNASTVVVRSGFDAPVVGATTITFVEGELDELVLGWDQLTVRGLVGQIYGVYLYNETISERRANTIAVRAANQFRISSAEPFKVPRTIGIPTIHYDANVGLQGITLGLEEWHTVDNGGTFVEQLTLAARPSLALSPVLGQVVVFDGAGEHFDLSPNSVPIVDWTDVDAGDVSFTWCGTIASFGGTNRAIGSLPTANGGLLLFVDTAGNLHAFSAGQSGSQDLVAEQIPIGRALSVVCRFGTSPRLIVNGVEFAQTPAAGPLGPLGAAQPGAAIGAGVGGTGEFFHGNIRDLTLTPRAISDAQIASAVAFGENQYGVRSCVTAWCDVHFDGAKGLPVGVNPIDAWGDEASPYAVTAAGTERPALVTLSGLPAASFDGVDDRLIETPNIAAALNGTRNPSFLVVHNPVPVAGDYVFQFRGAALNNRLSLNYSGGNLTATVQAQGGAVRNLSGVATGGLQLVSARYGVQAELRVDGLLEAGPVNEDMVNDFQGMADTTLGDRRSGAGKLQGTIGEIAVLAYTMGDQLRDALFNFLRDKWGTP